MATDTHKLSLQTREVTGKKVQKLRKQGILPIGVTGRGVEPFSAQVDEREFMSVINKAGYTGLIEISLPGAKKQSAFLQELQRHPISGRPLHADLKVVDVTKVMEIDVPIVAIGENALVEKGQATLNHSLNVLHVRALPTDIPHQIDVDISALTDFDQSVHVRDLPLPAGVELLSDPETLVFALAHPRAEEPAAEEAAAEEAAGDDE
ncbi:MAG TPA: 50S ribosomal protein L25 [Herpetosiphonaceae bacterium]